MANGWTPERRARQAALIRSWKPWEKSTGPTTEAGKAIVSKNHLKSRRSRLQQLLPAFQLAAIAGDLTVLLNLIDAVVGKAAPAGDSKSTVDFETISSRLPRAR